jgi:hypothetical protein
MSYSLMSRALIEAAQELSFFQMFALSVWGGTTINNGESMVR